MLKHILTVSAASLIFSLPASAQSADDIFKAESGNSCAGCNLFQADFSYQEIRNLNFSNARLRQANLSLSNMDSIDFSGANLSVANLFAGIFTNTDFTNANLTDSTVVGADFDGANFSGANLTGANFGGSELQNARGLTQRQLNKACGDSFTKLRGELTIPSCK